MGDIGDGSSPKMSEIAGVNDPTLQDAAHPPHRGHVRYHCIPANAFQSGFGSATATSLRQLPLLVPQSYRWEPKVVLASERSR